MFGEGDNGIIGFSLQQIQEMSCALLMQSGEVILCGIGFYRVHSPRGQSFLVFFWVNCGIRKFMKMGFTIIQMLKEIKEMKY